MTLALELCFSPDLSEPAWLRLLDVIFACRPALAPHELKRLSDADAPRREPWTAAHRTELARRLATENALAWTIVCAQASLLCVLEPRFVKLAALVKGPADDLAGELASLVEATAAIATPRIGMAYDADSDDRDLVTERLVDVPPVLFLGPGVHDVVVPHQPVAGGKLIIRNEATRAALALSEATPLDVLG